MYSKRVVVSAPQWASDLQAYVVIIIGYNGTGWMKCTRNLGDVWVPAQQSQESTGRQTLYQRVSLSQCAATYGIEALELCWALSVWIEAQFDAFHYHLRRNPGHTGNMAALRYPEQAPAFWGLCYFSFDNLLGYWRIFIWTWDQPRLRPDRVNFTLLMFL